MKHFLALPALLRSSLLLVSASQNAFSVQDDLLAFPQYEVRFGDEWLSDEAAQSKLLSNDNLHLHESDAPQEVPSSQVEQYQKHLGQTDSGGGKETEQVEYEQMILDGQRWLCRIPKVQKPAEPVVVNDTLTKAEEERELSRATERGWELLSGMQGNCVFFISGWWSYRFCYNQGIKQFHQLPPSRGVPVYPPVEDPGVPGFMLGTYGKQYEEPEAPQDTWEGEAALDKSEGVKPKRIGSGELVQRGESRYLVQKLGGGTTCDLTGKERKIEVQFHCNPQSVDRISLIKETSTCHYLMVIQTPRLCNDVAFQPPQKDQPNSISCSPILRADEVEAFERDKQATRTAEREAKLWEAMGAAESELPVGDIFVGEYRLVPEGQTIEKSAIVGGGKETYIDTLATSDGKQLSAEMLEKLGLADPKAIEELKQRLEKLAKGQTWKLDVIDTPRGREYRGVIGDEEDEEEGASGKEEAREESSSKPTAMKKRKSGGGQKTKDGGKKQEGSEEEYYREEL